MQQRSRESLGFRKLRVATRYGLLWWRSYSGQQSFAIPNDLLIQWKGNGVPDSIASKLAPIVGTKHSSDAAIQAAIGATLTPVEFAALRDRLLRRPSRVLPGLESAPGRSRYAQGWLGHYLDIADGSSSPSGCVARVPPTTSMCRRKRIIFRTSST